MMSPTTANAKDLPRTCYGVLGFDYEREQHFDFVNAFAVRIFKDDPAILVDLLNSAPLWISHQTKPGR